MPTRHLVIAPAAKTDLKNIYQYGLRQWGKTQSDSYLENIKEHFWTLTEQAMIGVDRSELLAGTRSLPIASHTLFYRVTGDTVEIIRVLHRRQDPQRHLT
ncbi:MULTISPECIES: type II toxin-antitoxin system RelE/ParE family toxin [unclassified Oleiphilus]|jgi:toxin ParE1/3/4|uniref:type II toxin-antitoxin system RelE/ParE family toxin n=1 Tax=unclassified Oleiphilus TaxID=2631174 RepID=UPI0007C2D9FD|nr:MULTISPECIES: type II toxin-antitoxin system RelE/ParE family toxin [unclassified Oleiphilus]KZY80461.1 plasmid stabilization protein [Oleiphilus sp. HI0069]KZY89488.1 plasmid stabilization protein [Oleiphilus sp. HI0072]KZZ17084.1 plasmid stabilization protein [Oleiphilus sp. HI0078]KZZ37397.1 plasmid stabilization protein [Oleiphilus sp. HI0085]KZY35181.1 plasmid stabilization protein [Oleiphilus sp. HI0043]